MDERLLKILGGLQGFVFKNTRLGMRKVVEDKEGIATVTFSPIDDRMELAGNRIVMMFAEGSSVIEVTGHRLEWLAPQIEQWVNEHITSGEKSCVPQ